MGVVNTSRDDCRGVVITSAGKILLGGSTFNNNNTSAAFTGGDNDALLVRLNANGSFDSSYPGDGVQLFVKKKSNDNISSMALQKNGSVLLSGNANTDNTFNTKVLLLRATSVGVLDNTFNSSGFVITDLSDSTSEGGNSIALQSTGKIVVTGSQQVSQNPNSLPKTFLLRYNANGKLDASFGSGGKTIFSKADDYNTGQSVAVDKSDRIVVAGSQYNTKDPALTGDYNMQVIRYKANGAFDSSFGSFGRTAIDLGGWEVPSYHTDYAYTCAVQSDNKIITAGYTRFFVNSSLQGDVEAVIRLLPSGRNYAVAAPSDTVVNLVNGCYATFNTLNPVLYPDTSLSIVKYALYNSSYQLYDSGYGSVNGKQFDLNTTTYIVYSSTVDPNQRAVFTVTVTGGTTANALYFDGVDDRVSVNANAVVGMSGTYTFEGWIKLKGYNKNGGSVIFGNQRGKDSGVIVALNANGFITTYHPKVGIVTSSYKVPLNQWTYIAFVQSSSKLVLYVNGTLVQTLLSAPNRQVNTFNPYFLGAHTDDGTAFDRHFNGLMDNVRILSTALCDAQIQNNLYCELESGGTNQPGLLTQFTFNQGVASCENFNTQTLNGSGLCCGSSSNGTLINFFLNGPISNWVADSGYVHGTCAPFAPLTLTSIPANITAYTQSGTCGAVVNFSGATATSGCADSIKITYSPASGTVFPTGTTLVTVVATDGTGNSVYKNFLISVLDTTAPSLITKDTTVRLNKSGNASVLPASVVASLTDNCSTGSNLTYNVFPTSFTSAGTYTVTVQAKDQYNNSTTKYETVTVLPYMGAGSAVLGNDALITTGAKTSVLSNSFAAVISPNPSRDYFTFRVQSSDLITKVQVRISDAAGKVLEVKNNVQPGAFFRLGSQYKAGVYIAEIIQGNNKKSYRLVRL